MKYLILAITIIFPGVYSINIEAENPKVMHNHKQVESACYNGMLSTVLRLGYKDDLEIYGYKLKNFSFTRVAN